MDKRIPRENIDYLLTPKESYLTGNVPISRGKRPENWDIPQGIIQDGNRADLNEIRKERQLTEFAPITSLIANSAGFKNRRLAMKLIDINEEGRTVSGPPVHELERVWNEAEGLEENVLGKDVTAQFYEAYNRMIEGKGTEASFFGRLIKKQEGSSGTENRG